MRATLTWPFKGLFVRRQVIPRKKPNGNSAHQFSVGCSQRKPREQIVKSTAGQHFIALDHVRALAAFMVFSWHFMHSGQNAIPTAYYPNALPFAVLEEGHTGVALFMTLSGYLFARLLSGRTISFPMFIYNRALRLFPLLVAVFILVGIKKWLQNEDLAQYAVDILSGLALPTWPNGGWSITAELHFYLLLPFLLLISRRSTTPLYILLICAAVLRVAIFSQLGEVQRLAYWTIVGRVDQFTIGIIAYHLSAKVRNNHGLAIAAAASFITFYGYFDYLGGFYDMGGYPSPSALWTIFPTIEGLTYGLLIAYYDTSFNPTDSRASRIVGSIGECSYSIYLLHFFFIGAIMPTMRKLLPFFSNYYIATVYSVAFFAAMYVIGYVSYHYYERPFLKLRKPYILAPVTVATVER